jgi:hypothetical protein
MAREQEAYWRFAFERVGVELAEAEAAHEEEVAAELRGVLAQFGALLQDATAQALLSLAGIRERVVEQHQNTATVEEMTLPAVEAAPVETAVEQVTEGAPAYAVVAVQEEQVEAAPATVSCRVSDEAREERIAYCCAELTAAQERWNGINAEGFRDKDGGLNRPASFRMRALKCTLRALVVRARCEGIDMAGWPELCGLYDAIDVARRYANDTAACLPLDREDSEEDLAAEDWEELAYRYEAAGAAQEAWEWYSVHEEGLSQVIGTELLNAIAGAQQALYLTLEGFGGRDRLQGDLYGQLMEAARRTGYLSALSPETRFERLESLAASLPGTLAKAQAEYLEVQERQAKEARKRTALDAFTEFAQNTLSVARPDELGAYRAMLFPLLDACQTAGIPATNAQIRNTLLECGPTLLEGEGRYDRIREAIVAERKRRGLDASAQEAQEGEDEDPTPAALAIESGYAAAFMSGLKLLILGGVPRQRVCEELQEALGCADVKWLESKKSDRPAKFQAEIKRAQVLVLVKNHAGHGMSEKGREWIKGVGGHYIMLPGGYGVSQIIHQIYRYVMAREERQ